MHRLMARLQRVLEPARFTRQEAGSVLRRAVVRTWLQASAPDTDITSLGSFFSTHTSLSSRVSRALQAVLADIPVGQEGTDGALTPEMIGHIGEYENTENAASRGIFYTPFDTARRLARETLRVWLQRQQWLPPTATQPDPAQIPAEKRSQADRALARVTVCDPACGAGGLLIPFWLELAEFRRRLNPSLNYAQLLQDLAARNLYAADINPQAVADMRLRMTLTLRAHGVSRPVGGEHFFVLDALSGYPHPVWWKKCPEVFARGGFDIYLANPPYVGQKNHKEIFTVLRQNPRWAPWLAPKSDLLYLFFHLAFEIVKPSGVAGLLTTSYFAQAAGAYTLRKRLHETACVLRLVDFGEEKLFRRAKGQHNLITVFSPGKDASRPCYTCGGTCTQDELFGGRDLFLNTHPQTADLQTALHKMAGVSYRLADVAQISNGLMTGCDRAFILTSEEKQTLALNAAERKKVKPFFKNSDISSYVAAAKPHLYLIDFFYPNDRNTDFSRYEHLLAHLAQFKEELLARKQNNNGIDKQLAQGKYWFGSVRRRMNFEAEKIVVPHRTLSNTFAYSDGPWYASSDVYFIASPRQPFTLWYLLALLNSAPYYAWLCYKGKRKGRLLELYSAPLREIPIPVAPPAIQHRLERLAQRIYEAKRRRNKRLVTHLQQQIDRLVCILFGFSAPETQAATLKTFVD